MNIFEEGDIIEIDGKTGRISNIRYTIDNVVFQIAFNEEEQ